MITAIRTFGCMVGVLVSSSLVAVAQSPSPHNSAAEKQEKKTVPVYTVAEYDPEADAADDLAKTVKRAQASGKRIILEIGGQW